MRTKHIQVSELPDDLINAHFTEIAPFSVALARITDSGTEPESQLLGSGTLIKLSNVHGILTARHVAELIQPGRDIDIVLLRSSHRYSVPTGHLDVLMSDRGATEESGPDIAFIRLPESTVGTIKAGKSFLELVVHQRRAEQNSRDSGLWTVAGFPNEKASILKDENRITFHHFLQCGVGPSPISYQREGAFDYYSVRARYSETNDLPLSYGGVSGGGLWQTQVVQQHGEFRIAQLVLRGVAFYQSPRSGDSRFIKCHGDESIYSWLLAKIDSTCS